MSASHLALPPSEKDTGLVPVRMRMLCGVVVVVVEVVVVDDGNL